MSLRIAVVIPVAVMTPKTARCLDACSLLTYEPHAIAVVSDLPLAMPADAHFVNLVTGAGYLTSPAEKRDFARTHLRFDADAYAYLDDDAYPEPDWVERIAAALDAYPQAAGVAGPGLAADDQRYWERVSAAALESWLGSGPLAFRFRREPARWCDDFPAYNLTLRRSWLDACGGWATDWYGGEDTELCARIADAGALIRYEPGAAVFHNRRALLPHHAWQIQNVGRSRGCFLRSGNPRYRKGSFAGPPAIVLAAAAMIAGPFVAGAFAPVASAALLAAYGATALFAHPRPLDWRVRLALPAAIVLQHAAYSAGLMRGLVTGRRRRARKPPMRQQHPSSSG